MPGEWTTTIPATPGEYDMQAPWLSGVVRCLVTGASIPGVGGTTWHEIAIVTGDGSAPATLFVGATLAGAEWRTP